MGGNVIVAGHISGKLSAIGSIKGTLGGMGSIKGVISVPTTIDVDIYDGVTEVTPSTQMQVLPVRNKTVTDNIIINPIPSNYGLVTWDGSRLTIS